MNKIISSWAISDSGDRLITVSSPPILIWYHRPKLKDVGSGLCPNSVRRCSGDTTLVTYRVHKLFGADELIGKGCRDKTIEVCYLNWKRISISSGKHSSRRGYVKGKFHYPRALLLRSRIRSF